jgi:hypothetical protein
VGLAAEPINGDQRHQTRFPQHVCVLWPWEFVELSGLLCANEAR